MHLEVRLKLSDMKPSKQRVTVYSRVSLLVDVTAMREQRKASVRDCARASGVSSATYCRIENGYMPDLASALKFAIFIGLPVEKIWKLSE